MFHLSQLTVSTVCPIDATCLTQLIAEVQLFMFFFPPLHVLKYFSDTIIFLLTCKIAAFVII